MAASLATDLEEARERLEFARIVGHVDIAVDAALDIVSLLAGIPGTSQRMREILERR
jgi:hypothetical protein